MSTSPRRSAPRPGRPSTRPPIPDVATGLIMPPDRDGLTLSCLVDYVMRTRPLAANTRRTYWSNWTNHLVQPLGEMPITAIRRPMIQQLLDGLSPSTASHVLAFLKMALAVAADDLETDDGAPYLPRNPAAKIRTRSVGRKPPISLTMTEVEKAPWKNEHRRRQMLWLARHGARWSEYKALQPEDIYQDSAGDWWVHIHRGNNRGRTKSGKGRIVPHLGPDPFPVFRSYSRSLEHCQEATGMSLHSLRRTYAFFLKQQGVPIDVAAVLMGHANPSLTAEVYTMIHSDEVADASERLRKAARRFSD